MASVVKLTAIAVLLVIFLFRGEVDAACGDPVLVVESASSLDAALSIYPYPPARCPAQGFTVPSSGKLHSLYANCWNGGGPHTASLSILGSANSGDVLASTTATITYQQEGLFVFPEDQQIVLSPGKTYYAMVGLVQQASSGTVSAMVNEGNAYPGGAMTFTCGDLEGVLINGGIFDFYQFRVYFVDENCPVTETTEEAILCSGDYQCPNNSFCDGGSCSCVFGADGSPATACTCDSGKSIVWVGGDRYCIGYPQCTADYQCHTGEQCGKSDGQVVGECAFHCSADYQCSNLGGMRRCNTNTGSCECICGGGTNDACECLSPNILVYSDNVPYCIALPPCN